MKHNYLFIESTCTDPYRNLAVEEHLTQRVKKGAPVLFLWQNDPCVVIGKNQNCHAECDLLAMEREGIPLVRRLSGGGAVWHDRGNLCFSFISHKDDHDIPAQLALVASCCHSFGIDAVPTGRNDIEVNGKKFSGNAFYQVGDNRCHHGTILISADRERLSSFLTVSRHKLEARGIPSVRSRVTNLSELNAGLTPLAFGRALANLCSSLPSPMPPEEAYLSGAAFFASRKWLYGNDPPFTDTWEVPTEKGMFSLSVSVQKGYIVACRVFTDSLDPHASERLEKVLHGTPFDREIISELIRRYQ